MSDWKKKLDKAVAYLKRNGVRGTIYRAERKLLLARPVRYEKWLKKHTANRKELDREQKEQLWKQHKVCAILFPGTEGEEKTRKSLEEQTYGTLQIDNWNRRLPNSLESAEYVLLIQTGTILRPEAVYAMLCGIRQEKHAVLYTDHDVREADGKLIRPFCKPDYDPVLFAQMNYIGSAILVSSSCLKEVQNLTAGQIWKKVCREAETVLHLPKLLYHEAEELEEQLDRADGWYQKKELERYPLLSVIIPNKDHGEDLKLCVDSLLQDGDYDNLEILIVENNSTQEETFQIYRELQQGDERIQIVTRKGEFNYSAINNEAVRWARGEYLLFLNNDTKVKKAGSVKELMRCAITEKAGAVGCRLLYGDHTIQHAGVVLGYGGVAGHAFEGMTQEAYEKQRYSRYARQMSAVTAACMLVNRRAFEAAGGFTEELGVAYNDIDLCMKLRKCGWSVLYDPAAEWYHYESQTRGFEMTAQKAMRVKKEAEYFCRTWKEELNRGDRFYNPNLTLEKTDFSLIR